MKYGTQNTLVKHGLIKSENVLVTFFLLFFSFLYHHSLLHGTARKTFQTTLSAVSNYAAHFPIFP